MSDLPIIFAVDDLEEDLELTIGELELRYGADYEDRKARGGPPPREPAPL
jgi:hypothetical protein